MRTYFDLTGRSALVTGAGAGIGAAVSEALAAAGAAVLVTDISGDAAAVVAERINTAVGGGKPNTAAGGGKADSAALDVSDRDAAVAAAAQAAALGEGNLHIVVNNAGVTSPAMFPKLTDETFRLTFDVHVMGTFHVTQAALPHLPTDGTGRVINVTSSAGITGTLGQVNYSAAKAGIIGMTKAAAKELAHLGVRVNAIAPGLIRSAMTEAMPQRIWDQKVAEVPMGRAGEPDEVAKVALFLASDLSSYMTGTVMEVTGGRFM